MRNNSSLEAVQGKKTQHTKPQGNTNAHAHKQVAPDEQQQVIIFCAMHSGNSNAPHDTRAFK
jgi:hypothetical protein